MTTAGIVNCLPYGMACTECNELLIAPKWSAHVSKREIRHFWSCDNCGHEIEMAVHLRFGGTSKPSASVSHGPVTFVG
jgi:transcription elongation factor Elf1